MILQELIAAMPLAKLARRAATEEVARPMTVKQRKGRTGRYLYFLETLLSMNSKPGRQYTLVETPYCDDGNWASEASLIRTEALASLLEQPPALTLHKREELAAMDGASLRRCKKALTDILPAAVDYTFLPWETVLGAEVRLPFWYREVEILPFLSSVIRTLSYAGFTAAQQEESRQRLVALMAARGEIMRLPREETDRRRAAIKDLFPAPPREQQDQLDRAMEIETILSLEGEYRMYKALAESTERTEGEIC